MSNKTMKIHVGTLYSGENEYEECCRSLQEQTLPASYRFVVKNRPNREAHEEIYSTFMANAGACDLFIKVDADMVLEDRSLFAKIADWMHANTNCDLLTVLLHDYFTGRLISGMHVFRSSVSWGKRNASLFVDHHDVPADRCDVFPEHGPQVATHCKNPSDLQAFHFGLHKATKVLEALKLGSSGNLQARFHSDNVELVWKNFLALQDRRLGFACIAAEMAYRGRFTSDDVNYGSHNVESALRAIEGMAPEEIRRVVRRLRRWNWGYLEPNDRLTMFREGRVRGLFAVGMRRAVLRPVRRMIHNIAGI